MYFKSNVTATAYLRQLRSTEYVRLACSAFVEALLRDLVNRRRREVDCRCPSVSLPAYLWSPDQPDGPSPGQIGTPEEVPATSLLNLYCVGPAAATIEFSYSWRSTDEPTDQFNRLAAGLDNRSP